MPDAWHTALIERLRASQSQVGGWGYSAATSPQAEPTSLAVLALRAHGAFPEEQKRGLAWLAGLQRPDGGVPSSGEMPGPCWPTAMAILAWTDASEPERARYAPAVQQAAKWLLKASGRPMQVERSLFGHDPTLIGWGWAQETHSWVEPTGYAILALRAAGHADDPRVREGVRLLLDRAIPDGGWNYGNTRVLEHMLRPFPAQTGIALTALRGESDGASIRAATTWLGRELERIRAPMSLAWGVIGLSAWRVRPAQAQTWLETCAERALGREPHPAYDALLLLAARPDPLLGGVDSGRSA